MSNIHINFFPFADQDFGIEVYRKILVGNDFKDGFEYYDFKDQQGANHKYEISHKPIEGYDRFKLPPFMKIGLIEKSINRSLDQLLQNNTRYFRRTEGSEILKRRLYIKIEDHPKGKKCMWIEPYFHKNKKIWGILVGYHFLVTENASTHSKYKLDKDILMATGTLNSKGQSNLDFYLFKYQKLEHFINHELSLINAVLQNKIQSTLVVQEGKLLKPKEYVFKNGAINTSPYIGLTKNEPLQLPTTDLEFIFLYKKNERDYAVSLLKGLKGETFPNTFLGFEKMFKVDFSNLKIKGVAVDDFTNEVLDEQVQTILQSGKQIIPVILMPIRKEENERLYYTIKNKFTNAGIACQVVTKELVVNENSLKYSLGNIALQIFAKGGGIPWKMKPATSEYLIIGLGQSYNIEQNSEGKQIQKNIAYSVLTDSSGIFKDIQILSEGESETENYHTDLVNNISKIITNSGYKKVAIHTPFKVSKSHVFEKVKKQIDESIELAVLVINDKTDLFGFDFQNNGLVPFESTFIKISNHEYLVWFEGLLFNNPKITKRFSNPLKIEFWYTNKPELFENFEYKENLLQDCINLSGANWRGFKAKQLPVSVYYCQRIAEFISKFREYDLSHIEINNLKPWFL
jgi:hypothetical protein